MPVRWRPRLLWIPMGGVVGAGAGAVVGIALLSGTAVLTAATSSADLSDLVLAVVAGAWFGGMVGGVVGLAVGLEMTFLVGSHLPREEARRRARWLGHVLPPVTMLAPFVVTGEVDLSPLDGESLWVILLLGAASAVGGPLARWIAGLGSPGPVVA